MQLIVFIFAHGLLVGDFFQSVGELLLFISLSGGIDFFLKLPAFGFLFRQLGFGVFQGLDVTELIVLIFAEGFEVLDALELIVERVIFINGRAGRGGFRLALSGCGGCAFFVILLQLQIFLSIFNFLLQPCALCIAGGQIVVEEAGRYWS